MVAKSIVKSAAILSGGSLGVLVGDICSVDRQRAGFRQTQNRVSGLIVKLEGPPATVAVCAPLLVQLRLNQRIGDVHRLAEIHRNVAIAGNFACAVRRGCAGDGGGGINRWANIESRRCIARSRSAGSEITGVIISVLAAIRSALNGSCSLWCRSYSTLIKVGGTKPHQIYNLG